MTQYLEAKTGNVTPEILNRIGIRRASDLLFYFPRDYQDMTERREFSQLEETETYKPPEGGGFMCCRLKARLFANCRLPL